MSKTECAFTEKNVLICINRQPQKGLCGKETGLNEKKDLNNNKCFGGILVFLLCAV